MIPAAQRDSDLVFAQCCRTLRKYGRVVDRVVIRDGYRFLEYWCVTCPEAKC